MNWSVEVKREKDVLMAPSSLFCHRNNNMAKQIKLFLLPQYSPYIKFNFGDWV
jgi:hypothetical protein